MKQKSNLGLKNALSLSQIQYLQLKQLSFHHISMPSILLSTTTGTITKHVQKDHIVLLLLLLSRFSRVRLCATPQMAAHQAPPSLGFSRQEYWSGLPFPSPMHESEKRKRSHSVMSDSSQPHGLQPTRLFCPWDFPGKSTGVGCHCLLRHLSFWDLNHRTLSSSDFNQFSGSSDC